MRKDDVLKMFAPKTKVIGGKRYTRDVTFEDKGRANKYAKAQRHFTLARVVYIPKGKYYAVYIKQKAK